MDISTNLKRIIALYRNNFLVLLIATFLTLLLSIISFGLLFGPLFAGLLLLCFKLAQEEKADYKEIFKHMDCFLPTFLITLLAGAVGLVTSIIGAIPLIGWVFNLAVSPALALITGLALAFVVDQNLKPLEAIKRSMGVCLTEPKMIWLYSLIIGFVGSLGVFLFIIPVIITAPVLIIGIALAYQQLSAREGRNLNLGRKEKQIGFAVLAGLFVVGLIFHFIMGSQSSRIGQRVFNRNRPGFSERIAGGFLSSIVGEKVEIGRDGSSFSVGGMTMGNQLPKGYPRDVPLYPKAEILSYLGTGNGDNSTTTFSTKDQHSALVTFYERELATHGWELETSIIGDLTIIVGKKENNRSCSVSITPPEDGETTFILTLKKETDEE